MNTKQYFDLFFEEKEIPYTSWELISEDGTWHLIDSDVVIDYIKNSLTEQDREKVRSSLVKIDLLNGKIIPFLQYIAGFMINTC